MHARLYSFFQPPYIDQDTLLISPLKISELEEFIQVARITYAETYPNYFTKEELNMLFGDPYLNIELPKQLSDGHHFYLVAKICGNIIGYAKLIYEDRNNNVLLDKIYFLKGYQGKGFGRDLLQACYRHALDRDKSTMCLRVWDKNKNAISFYEKYGFIVSKKTPYFNPDGSLSAEMDYIMTCDDIYTHLFKMQTVLAQNFLNKIPSKL